MHFVVYYLKLKVFSEADKCLLLWHSEDKSNVSRLQTSNLNLIFSSK